MAAWVATLAAALRSPATHASRKADDETIGFEGRLAGRVVVVVVLVVVVVVLVVVVVGGLVVAGADVAGELVDGSEPARPVPPHPARKMPSASTGRTRLENPAKTVVDRRRVTAGHRGAGPPDALPAGSRHPTSWPGVHNRRSVRPGTYEHGGASRVGMWAPHAGRRPEVGPVRSHVVPPALGEEALREWPWQPADAALRSWRSLAGHPAPLPGHARVPTGTA